MVAPSKAPRELGQRRGRKISYSAMQDSWAAYTSQHLGQRFERGRPKAQTRSEHLSPEDYKRSLELAADRERDGPSRTRANRHPVHLPAGRGNRGQRDADRAAVRAGGRRHPAGIRVGRQSLGPRRHGGRNHPEVSYHLGRNPAGWKTSIDEMDIGWAVSYLKRAEGEDKANDPVVGAERARLTMAAFKTSSPALWIAEHLDTGYRSKVTSRLTWDRPSAYRHGSTWSVAIDYQSAAPADAWSADPLEHAQITFAYGYDGENRQGHWYNVHTIEDAVLVMTRRETSSSRKVACTTVPNHPRRLSTKG